MTQERAALLVYLKKELPIPCTQSQHPSLLCPLGMPNRASSPKSVGERDQAILFPCWTINLLAEPGWLSALLKMFFLPSASSVNKVYNYVSNPAVKTEWRNWHLARISSSFSLKNQSRKLKPKHPNTNNPLNKRKWGHCKFVAVCTALSLSCSCVLMQSLNM